MYTLIDIISIPRYSFVEFSFTFIKITIDLENLTREKNKIKGHRSGYRFSIFLWGTGRKIHILIWSIVTAYNVKNKNKEAKERGRKKEESVIF